MPSASRLRSVSTAIGAALFFLTMAAFVRPPLLPDIGRELGMSAIGLGLLGSVFATGRLAADFPAGRISDRMRPGPMMSLSAVIVAAGSLMLALAPSPLVAFAATFVLGVASTFVLTTAMAHFARAPKIRRGAALSAFAGWLLAGQSFGPTTGGTIGAALGWRWAVGIAGIVATAVAVLIVFVRAPSPEVEAREPGPDGVVEAPVDIPRLTLAFIYLLPAVQFALGGALLQTLIPIVADGELDIGPAQVGLALGLGGVARLFSALAAGQISDRHSRRWALIPGLVLQAIGVLVFFLWASPVAWLGSIILVSFGSAGVNVGTTILADLTEGKALGKRLGAFRFTGDAAFMVAPLLSGWLYTVGGRPLAILPMLVFASVVTLGAIIFIPETRH
jgi:MFS family permease